jgi:hypothetical protein
VYEKGEEMATASFTSDFQPMPQDLVFKKMARLLVIANIVSIASLDAYNSKRLSCI